ncbi:type II toxin-antitoxin system RelE/ParE family toxin [Bradyrhizobium sp. SZCCHNS30582]|uniref:type II toxin-antitoxin system RelE/ParE family toxin n=1 Tax=unclassified Bradyrhizobium TaxID=2631580 RepID=UPI003967A1CA
MANRTALAKIAEFIARDNPDASRAVVGRVEEVFARIKQFPCVAHPADRSGIRIYPVPISVLGVLQHRAG